MSCNHPSKRIEKVTGNIISCCPSDLWVGINVHSSLSLQNRHDLAAFEIAFKFFDAVLDLLLAVAAPLHWKIEGKNFKKKKITDLHLSVWFKFFVLSKIRSRSFLFCSFSMSQIGTTDWAKQRQTLDGNNNKRIKFAYKPSFM